MKHSPGKNDSEFPRSYASFIIDQEYGFYVAEYFQELLYLERKRRERSRRPMLLMLLDIMRFSRAEQDVVVKKIAQGLFSLTRETDIKGWYSEEGVIGVVFTELNKFDKVVMAKKIRNGLTLVLPPEDVERIEITLHVFPHDSSVKTDLPANPVLYRDVTKKYRTKPGPLLLKRFMDIIGSIVGLALFSPFFLTIPILIKLTSRGPVLFRQERIGLYGKKFTFLKFRSMYVNNDSAVHEQYIKQLIAGTAEKQGGEDGEKPVFKIVNDRRITPLGAFLRKSSLDELPQFINVLRGDMSLVGPRPPIPYEMENYDIWHRRRVVEIRPGITGLWQVKGRSSTTFDQMVRLDIQYARDWSIWLDIKILFMTPFAVLRGKGAY